MYVYTYVEAFAYDLTLEPLEAVQAGDLCYGAECHSPLHAVLCTLNSNAD